jgi:transglutaminase-like putative cysteine protease
LNGNSKGYRSEIRNYLAAMFVFAIVLISIVPQGGIHVDIRHIDESMFNNEQALSSHSTIVPAERMLQLGQENGSSIVDPKINRTPSGIFFDDKLCHCHVSTNIPEHVLASIGVYLEGEVAEENIPPVPCFEELFMLVLQDGWTVGSGNVIVAATIPSVWTIGEDLAVKFDLYNQGGSTAYVTLHFEGWDSYGPWGMFQTKEINVDGYTYVKAFNFKTVYLHVIVPETPVGIKRSVASAGGDASYYHDFCFNFVQKYGTPSTLPPGDAMSSTSGNPSYYWEGLPGDGFNVPDAYGLHHPDYWSLRWTAGYWIDLPRTFSEYATASQMTTRVYENMAYWKDYEPADATAWSDNKIVDEGYRGVCDEFAILEMTLLRALGLPCRYVWASGYGIGHTWLECWTQNGGWEWIHTDPTWNAYNNPSIYESSMTYFDAFTIWSEWDDSIHYYGCPYDGGNTNRMLAYNPTDAQWYATYDGPNNYLPNWHDPCENVDWWADAPDQPANWWPNPIWGTASGTLTSSGRYICTSVNNGWATGPFWYKTIGRPFTVGKFRQLRVTVEFDNPDKWYKGCFALALYDENKELVAYVKLYEWAGSAIDMDFYFMWVMDDGTTKQFTILNCDIQHLVDQLRIYRVEGDGIWASGLYGYGRILTESEFQGETSRIIKYIGIQWRRGSGTYLNVKLHEILVSWNL